MIPYVDISILDYFTLKSIPCKPEAPWIKKKGNSVRFTDEIQDDVVDQNYIDSSNKIFLYQNEYEKYKNLGSNIKLKGQTDINFKLKKAEENN